jgi:hypothetical protein
LSLRFDVKQKVISDYLKVLDAEKRAESLGVGHILRGNRAQYSMDLKRSLNTLQNDVVYVRAIQLIAKHPLELRGQAGQDFVGALRDAGSERRAMKVMEDRDREISRADEERKLKKSRTPSTVMTRFMSDVGRVERRYPGTPEKLYMEGYTCPQLSRELKRLERVYEILGAAIEKAQTILEEQERTEAWVAQRLGSPASDNTSPAP